jgi:putative two-component system response regulator
MGLAIGLVFMKILIVDDDPVSLAKLTKQVSSLGHEVFTATDGREGLKVYKSTRVNMVLTDWVMPNMDGIALVKEVKRLQGSRYTYVIMITSQSDTDNMVQGIMAGADDFITKPVIKEELAMRIKAAERVLSFEARDIVIFAMANLAEARDPETGNHLERIRFYSQVLAETIAKREKFFDEITPVFIDNILLTSPLHDIGKVGIPDFVLLKPGRLDEKEFSIMQKHTLIGFEALNNALIKYPNAEYLRMSAEVALCHHEKYDGSGYPNGLRENAIPLSARIVALADVYDALVSKRVYKSAMPHDTAKYIIIGERGKHFDPEVVDAFVECESKFIEILNQYNSDL